MILIQNSSGLVHRIHDAEKGMLCTIHLHFTRGGRHKRRSRHAAEKLTLQLISKTDMASIVSHDSDCCESLVRWISMRAQRSTPGSTPHTHPRLDCGEAPKR